MRVKRGIHRHRRHKKLRSLAKGYYGGRRTTVRKAKEAIIKAGQHAYRDRRKKKRTFRRLWIVRLNAVLRERGTKYSIFIAKLAEHKVTLDRQTLSELAIHDPQAFDAVCKKIGL
jgi:large subunit ribosomal protein L20